MARVLQCGKDCCHGVAALSVQGLSAVQQESLKREARRQGISVNRLVFWSLFLDQMAGLGRIIRRVEALT
jgi:hypothetical protein